MAADARARPGGLARRRARVRARALPGRAVDRSPARADLDAAPTRALRCRAAADVACSGCTRLDSALRPGAPRPRRDPVRARLRARPAPASARSGCGRGGSRRRRPGLGAEPPRHGRAPLLGGRALLGHARRLRLPRPRRVRAVRLPRLAPSGRRGRRFGVLVFQKHNLLRAGGSPSSLGLGALVPCLLALGANLPGYGLLWRNTPLHSTRVPERLLPIACLCLAALAAVAVACVSKHKLELARASSPRSRAWSLRSTSGCRSTTRSSPTRTTLSTPTSPTRLPGGCSSFLCCRPTPTRGSVYLYYAMQAPRERPLGYATSAPPAAFAVARQLPERARELGVSVVVRYRDGVPRTVRSRER